MLAQLAAGGPGQVSAMHCSAMLAERAPGARPWVRLPRMLASLALPAPGVRFGVPSRTRSARLAQLALGLVQRAHLGCLAAIAASLELSAQTQERQAQGCAGSVRQALGAGRQVPRRTRLARCVRQAHGAAPLVSPVSRRATVAPKAHGVTLRVRVQRALARHVAKVFINLRLGRPPRRIASSASPAATTAELGLPSVPGAPRGLGAPRAVRLRAMFAQMALGPTSRVPCMQTIAHAVGVRTLARRELQLACLLM